ncbi:MAG: hypothetical protein GX944_01130 [Alphaproteobacteria bacterium]|nr:hypothetical protein [Alphaproteobacteria bacterium]
MKRLLFLFSLFFLICVSVYDANSVNLFSTSTDWESVTGLRYSQYDISFIRDKSIGNNGMELYFLDSFPCIGQAETARVWISPSKFSAEDKKAVMNITCVKRPDQIQFAWREASRNDSQKKTTGIINCQITGNGREIKIILNDCIKGKNWNE